MAENIPIISRSCLFHVSLLKYIIDSSKITFRFLFSGWSINDWEHHGCRLFADYTKSMQSKYENN